MWSGTSGYALDQLDYRIRENPISSESAEGWNWLFTCIDIQRNNHLIQTYISGSAQTWPDTFKSIQKALSKWGICTIYLKN